MHDNLELRALSRHETSYRYDEPDPRVLETFPTPTPRSGLVVNLYALEFTSLCPVTGQPDYGTIDISYVPRERCVESKSLKLYLMRYRNHGAFHEACVAQIAEHLATVLEPHYVRVLGRFRPRGGIAIWPVREVVAPGLDAAELAALVERSSPRDRPTW